LWNSLQERGQVHESGSWPKTNKRGVWRALKMIELEQEIENLRRLVRRDEQGFGD